MTKPEQMDLFAGGDVAGPAPDLTLWAPIDAAALSDRALLRAIPLATQAEVSGLTKAAVRRGLRDAIPALTALCRRFAGFGLDRAVIEQTAALTALAALGGKDEVTSLIDTGAIRGPGLRWALEAARALSCRLAPQRVLDALRDPDPMVRAAACGCARAMPEIIATLRDLLTDLHRPVTEAAAMALGRLGHREGIGTLRHLLRTQPDEDVIAAFAPIADDDDAVLLGQTALAHPGLARHVLLMLEACDTPRAEAVAAGIRRRLTVAGPGDSVA